MSEPTRVSTRVWEQRLRANPDVVKLRLCTLLTIATYMNSDGSNACMLESTIAAAVGISDRAVRDHIGWAREHGYLVRTARGHRRGDGSVAPSAYAATTPAVSTGTQLPVEDGLNRKIQPSQPEDRGFSTGRSADLNRKIQPSQPEVGDMPYKEDQELDQGLHQEQTKSTTPRAHTSPPTTTRKPTAGMLPIPVVVTSRRSSRPAAPKAPPVEQDNRPAALAGIADELVGAWAKALKHPLPRVDRRKFLERIDELLVDGFTADQIRDGMRLLWKNRHRCGIGMLPAFVQQAIATAEMPDNVHQLDRRAQSEVAWAQEAAIAAGADPGDPFTSTGNFFATTTGPNVIDGEIIRGTA